MSASPKLRPTRVAVVIATNRLLSPIDLCFAGFQRLLEDPRDLILVDNGSGGEVTAWGRREFPSITVITRAKNGYYCGGFNSGLEYALANGHEFALIVNADTEVVNPRFVVELLAVAERHPRGAFFGPMVFFRQAGVIQNTILTYPTFQSTVVNWFKLHFAPDRMVLSGKAERKVDFLNGVCVLCRMAALREFGLLDEVIGAYNEDTDWNWRAKQKNWYSVYAPIPSIIHHQEEQGYENYSEKMFMSRRNQVYWLLRANRRVETRLFVFFVLLQARVRQLRSRTAAEKRRYGYFINGFGDATRRLIAGEAPGEWFGPPLGNWLLP